MSIQVMVSSSAFNCWSYSSSNWHYDDLPSQNVWYSWKFYLIIYIFIVRLKFEILEKYFIYFWVHDCPSGHAAIIITQNFKTWNLLGIARQKNLHIAFITLKIVGMKCFIKIRQDWIIYEFKIFKDFKRSFLCSFLYNFK